MTIQIVFPVYNEADILERNTRKLLSFCDEHLTEHDWHITIADNGSSDQSPAIGIELAKHDHVTYSRIEVPGKGEAIMSVWKNTSPDIGLFIDADLAPQLDIIPELIASIQKGASIATGSRTHPDAVIDRPPLRVFVSAANRLLRTLLFRTNTRDTACGVKAVSKQTIQTLVPLIQSRQWFFDTELIIRAEREGRSVVELPVTWTDRKKNDGTSKIHVVSTSIEYIVQMLRLKKTLSRTSRNSS